MKRKTKTTAKTTTTIPPILPLTPTTTLDFSGLAVGHAPPTHQLSAQDEALFRAFQSNLLSLISHELRTPLTGILNAIGVIEERLESGTGSDHPGDFTDAELVRMARQNAQRLHRTLITLLDLAALESGVFHVRLKESDLVRLTKLRIEHSRVYLRDQGLKLELSGEDEAIALADPQKLGRAIDLCLHIIAPRADAARPVQVRISDHAIELGFALNERQQEGWDQAWTQARAGYQSGVASPASAFGGVLQSEQAFLTRTEEGLGSEFLLVLEIMRLHGGEFRAERKGAAASLKLALPNLSSEEALRAVLTSRAYQVSTELGSVALALVEHAPAKGEPALAPDEISRRIKKALFRNSDAVYGLPERKLAALVLDDCKSEDTPKLLGRIRSATGLSIIFGAAHYPTDGIDPLHLLELAERRLEQARRELAIREVGTGAELPEM